MALNAGNADCTAGLAQRIYGFWTADGRAGFSPAMTEPQRDAVRALCWAVAQAVVAEIQANAVVAAVDTQTSAAVTGTVS